MTESPVTNKTKEQLLLLWSVFLQKSKHLIQEISYDPAGGFIWWLKTHKQKLAFDEALVKLRQNARKPDFQLDEVTRIFSEFILKEDDAGQVQWYQDAHNQLLISQQQLAEASILKEHMIKQALIELRFISEADQFHEYFQLQPLQRRVRDMYDAILKRLDILLEDTKKQNQQHKLELEIRQSEAEAKQAAEQARHSKHQLKKERAALKKIEKERILLDSQRDADEAAWKREEAARKLQIQESQHQQQIALQDSFQTMKFDRPLVPSEVSKSIEGETGNSKQQLETLLHQIKTGKLDRQDPVIKEQLQDLLQAIVDI